MESSPKNTKSFFDKISQWIGLFGSIATIILTIINIKTKADIDKRKGQLKAIEVNIKERTTGVEESKERVERYKWVLSLFPSFENNHNDRERSFVLNIMRLALSKEEAQQLFTGLQKRN